MRELWKLCDQARDSDGAWDHAFGGESNVDVKEDTIVLVDVDGSLTGAWLG